MLLLEELMGIRNQNLLISLLEIPAGLDRPSTSIPRKDQCRNAYTFSTGYLE